LPAAGGGVRFGVPSLGELTPSAERRNLSLALESAGKQKNRAEISIIITTGGGFTMGIQPLQDWALIEPSEAKEKTTGGLFIPDTAKEIPVEGKVLAVGKGRWETLDKKKDNKPKKKEEKVFRPTVLKPGDQVLYEKYGTTEVDLDGKELVLVRESDVLGLVG
jgi:chaperonin GroES